MKLLFR